MIKLLLAALLGLVVSCGAAASVRIDVKNDTSEDCSLAINARTDKTKWVTEGWYVFSSGEEAPIILKDISEIHNVFIYNDCFTGKFGKDTETKKAWVKTNLQFRDEVPRDRESGYEEVVFTRLKSNKYIIQSQ